jgi:hypothetical protein
MVPTRHAAYPGSLWSLPEMPLVTRPSGPNPFFKFRPRLPVIRRQTAPRGLIYSRSVPFEYHVTKYGPALSDARDASFERAD